MPRKPTPTHATDRTALAAAFPLLLWFIATFFLLGDIGRWNDDWFYIQRVPETGAVRSLVQDRPAHFWRPLYRVITPALGTLLWEHEQVHHFIGAAVHGVNAWLLWLLLRRLGARRLACGLGAVLFLVFPWDSEVALWPTAMPTGLATAVMLGSMHLVVSWARGRVRGWAVPVCAAATFAACCLNEQPAMFFAALPIVALCAAPTRVDRRFLLRAGLLWGAGALAAGAYSILHARHSPGAMNIGEGHGVLPVSRWPSAAARVWAWADGYVGSRHWLGRAWERAGSAMAAHPARAVVVLAAGIAAGVAWVVRMRRHGDERASDPAGPGGLALLGAAAALLPMVPIVAFDYGGSPRILYSSVIGLSILLVALLDAIGDRTQGRISGGVRGATAGLGAVALGAMALALVGVQEAYRARAAMDQDLLARLRALVPSPSPASVLVPVRIDRPACPEHGRGFDEQFGGVFNSWWSATWSARLAFARSDLEAGNAWWGFSALRFPAYDGARVDGVGRVTWDRMVPFEIDAMNQVRLVTGVRFVNAAGVRREVRVPQTAAMAERGLIEERWFEIAPPER